MISSRELLNMVFNREQVDRVPCICPGGMMNMVTTEVIEDLGIDFSKAHSNAQTMADLATAVYEKGYFENYGVLFCMTIESEEFGSTVNIVSPACGLGMKSSLTNVKAMLETLKRRCYRNA